MIWQLNSAKNVKNTGKKYQNQNGKWWNSTITTFLERLQMRIH